METEPLILKLKVGPRLSGVMDRAISDEAPNIHPDTAMTETDAQINGQPDLNGMDIDGQEQGIGKFLYSLFLYGIMN